MYLVDPTKICPSQGTTTNPNYGGSLYLQNGPTSETTLYIPPSQDEIDRDVEQVCINNDVNKKNFAESLIAINVDWLE